MAFVSPRSTIGELRKHVISDEKQACIKVRKRTKSSLNPIVNPSNYLALDTERRPPVKIDNFFFKFWTLEVNPHATCFSRSSIVFGTERYSTVVF